MQACSIPSGQQLYKVASVFTQKPDTSHILAADFNVTQEDVRSSRQTDWKQLNFRHIGATDRPGTYSSVDILGDQQKLAAPGSGDWIPQLLDTIHDYVPSRDANDNPLPCETQSAGLIGSLPILLSMAAFSAPEPRVSDVMTNYIRRGRWIRHSLPDGRK